MATTNGNVGDVYGPVNLGNHVIAGNLSLGPEVSTATIGPGQVTGQVYTDFNVSFADAQLPPALTNAPAAVSTNGQYVFTQSGSWSIPSTGATTPIIVQPGITVQLRVDATNFKPTSVHVVTDTNTGISGSLIVYQVSGSMTLGGSTVVDSGIAGNFYYYGLPGVTSISCGGSSTFVGAIYAPEANMTLNGGGSGNNFVGALVVKNLTLSGHYNIHFDSALLRYGPKRGYVPASWQEM
jgi:hypothetical protein